MNKIPLIADNFSFFLYDTYFPRKESIMNICLFFSKYFSNFVFWAKLYYKNDYEDANLSNSISNFTQEL